MASPGVCSGDVTLKLTQGQDRQVHLNVSDNGEGLPFNFDGRKARSLGVQLVTDLVRQLGGQAVFESVNGTVCRITFPNRTVEPDRGA